ncbi:hypothetical protein [uncultured Cohaesibacter sp.]|uniref:hypothetical protein n=1 Tax=uncultured Cohaesibacter sp. TaxID=1002546 RepID=UPI0029C71C2A|nr:hypothetical protein [uncultured Cohaesibacter sp.]
MGICEPYKTLAIDTHFHANVFRRPHARRRRIAEQLARRVRHLDGLCSTEHAYKNPLEAYDFLCDMAAHHHLDLTIIAAVENISREGVEVIQLFESRAALVSALKQYPAFSWSIDDAMAMQSSDCVTILPHPFSPSTTGIVSGIGLERASGMLSHFDYIEMSNGSFLEVPLEALPRTKFRDQVEKTTQFPEELLPVGVGRSYGSDAHRPEDINLFSSLVMNRDETIFSALTTRRDLLPITRTIADFRAVSKISRSLLTSSIEFMQKQDYKITNRPLNDNKGRKSRSRRVRSRLLG